jgi:archaeosine-15-forming tRNA-guanine transglycosylase
LINIKSEISSNAYFIVTDAAGNILKTGKLNNGVADLTGLHKGMLTITVRDGNMQQSGKVLKE